MGSATQFELDRESGKPLGVQLSERLQGLVGGGRLRPGEQLPSVRQMAALAGVNVNTVRSVYAKLEQQGLLSSEHGRGTFVRGPRDAVAAAPDGRTSSDREYRRELMRQIAELERQIAYYTRHQIPGVHEQPRTRPASQLLPATQLMAVRDELLDRAKALRGAEEERLRAIAADREAAEAQELAERDEELKTAGRRSRGTAASPPRIVSGSGAWVLKWRG